MRENPIKENSFDGSPGGMNGISSVQPGYGTFASPEVSQNSANFASNDNNKALGNTSNTSKGTNDTGSMERDLKVIYSRKVTPTPDEVVTGIKWELGRQIKKDKGLAKQNVIANLKKDPKFYSSLKMLNIDDESMVQNMSEQKSHPNDKPHQERITPNIAETKKIFEELAVAKDNKYVVNSGIVEAMKQTAEAKRQRSSWKNGDSK